MSYILQSSPDSSPGAEPLYDTSPAFLAENGKGVPRLSAKAMEAKTGAIHQGIYSVGERIHSLADEALIAQRWAMRSLVR